MRAWLALLVAALLQLKVFVVSKPFVDELEDGLEDSKNYLVRNSLQGLQGNSLINSR